MPKYRVLRPIERNRVLHLPQTQQAPEKALSGADGKEIPVDASGYIELTTEEEAAFTAAQIERPTPSAISPAPRGRSDQHSAKPGRKS